MNLDKIYPLAPANVPAGLTRPSATFRLEVRNVIITLIAFVLTYFLMVALGVGLAWICFEAGLFILKVHIGLFTILIGFGIILMGALVVFFLIKFLFASSDVAQFRGVQIHESDEPQLFAFIRQVAEEVGTPFPHKIYLIPDVNASVFYSSSFWSLFIPTRKNLNIGLGLVNSLNISEFKAVLAHEFGHFSQKSMSIGSYVYYVNQVIFNMLYDNNGWVSAANGLAGVHAILSFFVQLSVYIVQGVQWVLRGMYSLVNQKYLRLSRAMEFHADTISASVSGSNIMSQALRQVELGSATYQQVLQKCNELLTTEQAPLNFYAGQRVEAAHFAAIHKLPLQQGLPCVTHDFMQRRQHPRVNFMNQWASHPTLKERQDNLESLNLQMEKIQESAWILFQEPVRLQQMLTEFLYRDVDIQVKHIEDELFVKIIETQHAHRKLPDLYEGYFDGHAVFTENWEIAAKQVKRLDARELKQLFEENLDDKITALEQDAHTLQAISKGEIDTKTFDFDGQKYHTDQIPEILPALEKDIADTLEERNRRDKDAISAFFALAKQKGPAYTESLQSAYKTLNEVWNLKNELLQHAGEVFLTIHYLAANNFNLATDMVQRFKNLYSLHEPKMREIFLHLHGLEMFPDHLQMMIQHTFLGEPIDYHQHNQPNQSTLENLHSVTLALVKFLEESAFEKHKAVLQLQEGLVD